MLEGEDMVKVAIVEDDEIILEELSNCLKEWNFEVNKVDVAKDILQQLTNVNCDIVLLDVHLPNINGISVCRQFRKFSNAPVIFISSDADRMSMVSAYEYGGDDYIVKPFDKMVLIAKLNAFIRRMQQEADKEVLVWRGVELNLRTYQLKYQGKMMEITKNEMKILELLMSNPHVVISRSDMMMALWNSDCYVDDNTLSVNVGRLRKKLEDVFRIDDFIHTKKGTGYYI